MFGVCVCVRGFWTISRFLGVSVFVCLFDEEAHPYSMKCVSATEMPGDQHSLINLACVPMCVCCVQPNIMVNLSSVYNFTQDDDINHHITLQCVIRVVMLDCIWHLVKQSAHCQHD